MKHTPTPISKDTAAYIYRACVMHDELVEAAKEALWFLTNEATPIHCQGEPLHDALVAVLKKAEEI